MASSSVDCLPAIELRLLLFFYPSETRLKSVISHQGLSPHSRTYYVPYLSTSHDMRISPSQTSRLHKQFCASIARSTTPPSITLIRTIRLG